MNRKLTLEIIHLYNQYYGDWRKFCNESSSHDLTFIDYEIWKFISQKHREITQIANRFTAFSTTKNILSELQKNAEPDVYNYFVNKIPFYKDFQLIKQILLTIQSFITPETDTLWTTYNDAEELLKDVSEYIEMITYCDFTTLEKIELEFAPTFTFQELAMANGWSDEYMKLADQFDLLNKKLNPDYA